MTLFLIFVAAGLTCEVIKQLIYHGYYLLLLDKNINDMDKYCNDLLKDFNDKLNTINNANNKSLH